MDPVDEDGDGVFTGGNNDGNMKNVPDNSTVSPDESESIIARELMHLSIQERDEVLHDLHGVASTVEEKPEFVEKCLYDLETELADIEADKKKVFEDVMSTNPSYVGDRGFRIMFLRSVKFDAPRAAGLMVNYFEKKARLFGMASIARNVVIRDLDKDAMACLKSGYVQLVPGKDRSGRSVLMGVAKLKRCVSEVGFAQAFWYMAMAALEDEEAQRKGLVMVSYAIDNTVQGRSVALQISSVLSALPMRVVGVHVCVNDPTVQALAKVLSLVFESRFRLRIRIHSGTDLECQYSMMTFGLPIKQMPVSLSGEVDKIAHSTWIQERTLKAEREDHMILEQPDFIDGDVGMPGPFDVLFGRGKFVQEHSGNQIFRQMIEEYRGRYDTAMKVEKTHIAKEIVQTIYDSGGRFLKQSDDSWIAVSVHVARDKVSHSFRNRRVSSGPTGGLNRRHSNSSSSLSTKGLEDLRTGSSTEKYGGMRMDHNSFFNPF